MDRSAWGNRKSGAVAALFSRAPMDRGFDVLYACQDYEFDRREGLQSIPARVGIGRALLIARALHAAAFMALVWLYLVTKLGPIALLVSLPRAYCSCINTGSCAPTTSGA